MKLTPNYKLKKPGANEYYNIEDFNENADIIDRTLKKAMDGAVSVQIGGTEPTAPNTLWFNTGAASPGLAMLLLNDDTAGAEVFAVVDGKEYGVENATVNSKPTAGSYDFTVL